MRRECRERFSRHRGLAIPIYIMARRTVRHWKYCRTPCKIYINKKRQAGIFVIWSTWLFNFNYNCLTLYIWMINDMENILDSWPYTFNKSDGSISNRDKYSPYYTISYITYFRSTTSYHNFNVFFMCGIINDNICFANSAFGIMKHNFVWLPKCNCEFNRLNISIYPLFSQALLDKYGSCFQKLGTCIKYFLRLCQVIAAQWKNRSCSESTGCSVQCVIPFSWC